MSRPAGWKGYGFAWQAGCPACQDGCFGWFYNWGWTGACPVCGAPWNPWGSPDYVHMVYGGSGVYPDGNLEGLVALHAPGRYWMVWNEPDLRSFSPAVAAQGYANAYWTIKSADPTAVVGGPNLVCMAENGRCTTGPWCQTPEGQGRDYLAELVQQLQALSPPPGLSAPVFDFYCVHAWVYIPPGGVGAGGLLPLDAQGRATYDTMRRPVDWIHSDAFGTVITSSTPVWITETGQSGSQDDQDAIDRFMDPLVNWLDSTGFARNVTKVAWYTTTDVSVPAHNLCIDAHGAGGRFETSSDLTQWTPAGGGMAGLACFGLTQVGTRCVWILNQHDGWWAQIYQPVHVNFFGNVFFSFWHYNGDGWHTGAHVKLGYSPNSDELYNSWSLDGDANPTRRVVTRLVNASTI